MGIEREDAVGLGGELLPGGGGRREVDALPGSLTELPARHAHKPFVLAALQLDEFGGRGLGEIDAGLLGVAMTDLEDASGRTVDAVLVVALADVAPVEEGDGAVRALAEFDASEPRVVGLQDIRLVLHDERAALPLDAFDVHAPAMQVQRHEFVAILRGPVVALVDHHADVRVTAAEAVRAAAAAVSVVPLLAGVPVIMVGLLVDELVDERVRVFAVHALEVRAMDALPAVADDRIDEEQLVVLGPIRAPRVGGAVAIRLEDLRHRVIAPETAGGGLALLLGHAGHVDPRGAGDADAAVEPAIGTPLESVGESMTTRRGGAETVQHDLGRTGGLVAIHRDEDQVRWADGPDAPEAALDAREHLDLVREDGPLVELPVVVGVLKDDDPVAQAEVEALLAVGIGVVLGDPQAAAFVPAHRDRLTHVRFGGEERGLEAVREMELGQGIGRLEDRDGLLLVVMRLRERRGEGRSTEDEGKTTDGHGGMTTLCGRGSASTPDPLRNPLRSGRRRRSRRSAWAKRLPPAR